jgi:hypothetical protein
VELPPLPPATDLATIIERCVDDMIDDGTLDDCPLPGL